MTRLSHILLLIALSSGPGVLWAQTESAAGPDKDNEQGTKEVRRFRPPQPGGEERPSGEWRGRGSRDGSKDGRGFRNPMDDFRRLLAMSKEERENELADKPEGFRTMLQDKLKEYDALTPEEQELRIRSTELRFDLMSLLGASPERRTEKLERIPENRRDLVKARLEQWDALPAELKEEVLEHQSTLHYVIRLDAAPEGAKEDIFAKMPPEYRERIKARIANINAKPEEQRKRMIDNFHKLFDLSEKDQQNILQKLDQEQREKMEKRLADYEKLPPDVRKQCMDSAHKFNKLSAEEKARFLEGAERWKTMSEEERNTWRNLIKQMPPLPPGLNSVPPLPPGASVQAKPALDVPLAPAK